jgi:plastocyanin
MFQRSLRSFTIHIGLAGAVASLSGVALYSSGSQTVRIEDRCDPATFNAALEDPNACVGDGDTTFDEFIADTIANGGAEHWRFKEDEFHVRVGESVKSFNEGGEAHTFTPVAKFGGGFVDVLNVLSGAGAIVPECIPTLDKDKNFVAPGPEFVFPNAAGKSKLLDTKGVQRFQCCVHPWMRSVVTVRNR